MSLSLYVGREVGAYGYDEKEWFRPSERMDAFLAELEARGLRDRCVFREAPPATDADLQLFHTAAHLAHVRAQCATNDGALDHGPTFARATIEVAARWMVGAVIDATRRILDGQIDTAFLPISGFHHAHPEEARLYCLYNDPAIALCEVLATVEGNVAYVDVDIHQGDGVYEGFANEPRVCMVDLHQDWSTLFPHSPDQPGTGHFPGRRDAVGRGPGAGTKLNIPLAPNTADQDYLALWDEAEAFLHAARPRFVVFESGVDGLEGDPMSNQHLTPELFAEVTRRVRTVAREHASGRLLVLGGGGYDLRNIAVGWCAIVEALLLP